MSICKYDIKHYLKCYIVVMSDQAGDVFGKLHKALKQRLTCVTEKVTWWPVIKS
jgi:hypothetical protein